MPNTNSKFSVDIGGMRSGFVKNPIFTEDQLVAKEPIAQFCYWFEKACANKEIRIPNAMCLATCTKSGIPSARFVLLKAYGKNGFKFFTNYNSRKGQELTENPNAALVFFWEPIGKSVRVEGTIEKLSPQESTKYYQSRPKLSQIAAKLSRQSRPIPCRSVLDEKQSLLKEEYANSDVLPRPDEWGGFILKPHTIEFWQGQSDCLHDRIRFRIPKKDEVVDNILLHQGEEGWAYERLQP